MSQKNDVEIDSSTHISILDRLGEAIFNIRWGLVPMYLGLWFAMCVYIYQFFREIWDFTFYTDIANGIHFNQFTSDNCLMWVLNLIDITMIGNLIVMITVGGFNTFVKEFDLKTLSGKPRWMNGLDSSALKIKMSMSLVGVSAIQLLKAFINIDQSSWDNVLKQVLIHVVFIVTTLAFTLNAKLNKHGKDVH